MQVTSGTLHGIPHNYFTRGHRKYSGPHNQCDIDTVHDGKVGCNTVEYTTAFLYLDWLYFLWHGMIVDEFIYTQGFF